MFRLFIRSSIVYLFSCTVKVFFSWLIGLCEILWWMLLHSLRVRHLVHTPLPEAGIIIQENHTRFHSTAPGQYTTTACFLISSHSGERSVTVAETLPLWRLYFWLKAFLNPFSASCASLSLQRVPCSRLTASLLLMYYYQFVVHIVC